MRYGERIFDDDDGKTATALLHLLLDQAAKYGEVVGRLKAEQEDLEDRIIDLKALINDQNRIITEQQELINDS